MYYKTKNLQQYYWLCFVLTINCWAFNLSLRVVFMLSETLSEKTNFSLQMVISWRQLLGWGGGLGHSVLTPPPWSLSSSIMNNRIAATWDMTLLR